MGSSNPVEVIEFEDYLGPGGEVVTVLMILFPLVLLIVLTLLPRPLPTTTSLPLSALLMFIVRLAYLGFDVTNTCAAVVQGILEMWTPVAIIAGAIFLFSTMTETGCMNWIMAELKSLSKGHPVAEFILIAWAFAYMIEGASGFGTPVALASPMLTQLGYSPFQSVVACLLMNTLATVFGAVGTPIWYGFEKLPLHRGNTDVREIGFKASCGIGMCAIVIPILAGMQIMPLKVISENWIFWTLSILSVVLPSIAIAFVSYEFPSLVSGMLGIIVVGVLVVFQVGLRDVDPKLLSSYREKVAVDTHEGEHFYDPKSLYDLKLPNERCRDTFVASAELLVDDPKSADPGELRDVEDARVSMSKRRYAGTLVLRTLPLWLSVVLLVLTRIPAVGLKGLMTSMDPHFTWTLRNLMNFQLAGSLKMSFLDILTDKTVSAKFETLYVPGIVPFMLVGIITYGVYWKEARTPLWKISTGVLRRMVDPTKALAGGLILVALIRIGTPSPAFLLGSILASWVGRWWILFTPIVGSFGAFISGSTTISNLTFGYVHLVAANASGLRETTVLALQAVGGTLGNAVCINNIISARAVMGLSDISEARFLRKTAPVIVFCWFWSLLFIWLFFMTDDFQLV